MAQTHAQVDDGANSIRQQNPSDIIMSQIKLTPVTGAGNATLSAAAILSGAIQRTGPTAAYADVFPSAEAILAACPMLGPGDSFDLLFLNTVAFANTPTQAAQGIVFGSNTSVAASNTRQYLLTCLSAGINSVQAVTTTNTSAVLTGFSAIEILKVRTGMGASGTGIPANTTVVSVNQTNNTVTLSANATASGNLIPITFFPRIQLDGVFSSAL